MPRMQFSHWPHSVGVFHILICMYGRRSTNTYSHDKTNLGARLEVSVLRSTAVQKLCALLSSVQLHTHFSIPKFVFFCLHSTGLTFQ